MNLLKVVIFGYTVLGVVACANVPTNALEGTESKSKISLQFQDFPEGAVCEVKTPNGSVVSPSFPGVIEYPAIFRDSPVTCTTPDGIVYDLLMNSVLPESFRTAGITAYIDGLLIATTSGERLIQSKNEEGVVERK